MLLLVVVFLQIYLFIYIYEELIVRFHILEENYLSTDRIFLIGL